MSGDGRGDRPVRRTKMIERPQPPPGPLADLKALIYELYLEAGTPSLDKIASWIANDRDLDAIVGRDTVHRIIGGPGMPPSQAHMTAVVTVLARAALWDPDDAARRTRDLWVTARMASARSPAAGVRVSEADPRRLGVHAAISVPGMPDEIPPEYVPRDADDGEFGARAKVTAAARRGGFVLLVGGSSVGKTRSAFEAVTALLPDWWLVHPAGPGEVAELAAAPTPRTVIWLDELQRYLGGERGLTGAVVRAMLNPPHPAVIIGTLWPDFYAEYTAPHAPGGTDPHAREREVLRLGDVVRIDPEFTAAEQDRARAAAARNPRLRVALNTPGYGLTQTLAAAPQLVARWEDAKTASPYAWAVLTAALDAARLGARAPLSADLLRAAAPGYCSSQQQAEAPGNWFEQALAYATGKLDGAVALTPAGADMGQISGYIAADYLIQHSSRERHLARVPASTWDALVSNIHDQTDAIWLANSADRRRLYGYAIPLYRHVADAGNGDAAWRLASLLTARGDLDGLRARADAGERIATLELCQLLAERGDLDELRARADAGDRYEYAASQLADLLAQRGDLDELRARADAGDGPASRQLAHVLAQRGDLDLAVQILRARADAGDEEAAPPLADLLARRGDLDELRARADTGDKHAVWHLADLLAKRGDLDLAIRILRSRAEAGNEQAAGQLADPLAEHGDLDGLRGRAYLGEEYAARLLAQHGYLEELRVRADAGDGPAAFQLARLLARRGDLKGLRGRADAGDKDAVYQLADLLAERGDLDLAIQKLRARADGDDAAATAQLVGMLTRCGDLDELRARADAGDEYAAQELAKLLARRGDLDELRARANGGDVQSAAHLADLLALRGDLDELRARVAAGDLGAAQALTRLLIAQGRAEEAERFHRFGLNLDGSIACA